MFLLREYIFREPKKITVMHQPRDHPVMDLRNQRRGLVPFEPSRVIKNETDITTMYILHKILMLH
jgi:hypothetical protein